jgi:hypothetical protein
VPLLFEAAAPAVGRPKANAASCALPTRLQLVQLHFNEHVKTSGIRHNPKTTVRNRHNTGNGPH